MWCDIGKVAMLDLTNSEHREALRWACEFVSRRPIVADGLSQSALWPKALGLRGNAMRALSSPVESAALVRALLERCGVDVGPWDDDCAHVNVDADTEPSEHPTTFGAPCVAIWIHGERQASSDAPALILRLLDAKTREEALAAPGGVGLVTQGV